MFIISAVRNGKPCHSANNSGQHDRQGCGIFSVKTLGNSPSGLFLRNDATELNSHGSDTNPLKSDALAERGKTRQWQTMLVDGMHTGEESC